MKICELLDESKIVLDIKSKDKLGAINELIELFKDDERIVDLEMFKKAVFDREKIMSTGVGKGFAVPHAKTNWVKDVLIAFGRCSEPIPFESLDGQPVDLIVLLAARENQVAPHIRFLSRISRMMNSDEFRNALKSAKDEKEILNIFCEQEKKYEAI